VPARIEAIRGGLTAEIRAELGENEARSEEERDGRWALRREYRLTYRQDLTDTETLVAGTCWDGPAGAPPAHSLV
jgi:predicted lysophospholipase L1 biosynthesis ABC-type transport system permease subunit